MIRYSWVAIGSDGRICEIFKSQKAMLSSLSDKFKVVDLKPHGPAVQEIREQIWERQNGQCINCPALITWGSLHLHEKLHRGQGGTYSLENDEGLCADCHLRIMHPEKQLNFGKKVK